MPFMYSSKFRDCMDFFCEIQIVKIICAPSTKERSIIQCYYGYGNKSHYLNLARSVVVISDGEINQFPPTVHSLGTTEGRQFWSMFAF
jgi:hypothetical protein